MALEYAHGAVQWLSTDGASTTYTISGLAFQPKAIKFFWNGLQSSVDATSTTLSQHRGIGFAVSTSSRCCIASYSEDASTDGAHCVSLAADDCVVGSISSSGSPRTASRDGELDLNSIETDGFVLIVDDPTPVSLTVFWEAWGGTDITVAVIGQASEPAATGTVDYTVTGFDNNALGDQVVMVIGSTSSAAVNTASITDSGIEHGFATSTDLSQNVNFTVASDEASVTTDTNRWAGDKHFFAQMSRGGGSINGVAVMSAFATDKFTLNWTSVGTANRRNFWLAIKGGRWRAGSIVHNARIASATSTVAGLPFTPVGVDLFGVGYWNLNGYGELAPDVYTIGCASSTSSRRSLAGYDQSAVTTSNTALALNYSSCACIINASGTVTVAIDINQMTNDGFELITDTATSTEHWNMWFGYLSFGSVPPSAEQEGYRWRNDDGNETAATWVAAQDTNISRNTNVNTRIRVLLDTTLNTNSGTLKLQYKRADEPDSEWRDV